jgi:peptidoglycan/LPS O-acetylase OafA/YrhL
MRGVAAVAVLLYHCDWVFGFTPTAHSYLAVDLFFALSGFVIAHAYGRKITGGLSLLEFLKIRLIRLYPLYLLGTGLGLLMKGATLFQFHRTFVALMLASLALAGLPNTSPLHRTADLYPLNAPAWSLFYEFGVNVLLVLAWKKLSARFLFGLIGLGLCGFLLSAPFANSLGWTWGGFPTGCMRTLFSFFIGVALYRWRHRLPTPRVSAWIVLAATTLLLLAPVPAGAVWQGAYDLVTLVIAIPLLVAVGAKTEPLGAAVPWFRFAGVTSYAAYILHDPLIEMAHRVVPEAHLNPILAEVVFVFLVIGFAWLADRLYDLPMRRFLSRTFAPSPPPPPVVV